MKCLAFIHDRDGNLDTVRYPTGTSANAGVSGTCRDAGYDTSRRITRIAGSIGLARPQPLLHLTYDHTNGGADTSLIQTVTRPRLRPAGRQDRDLCRREPADVAVEPAQRDGPAGPRRCAPTRPRT